MPTAFAPLLAALALMPAAATPPDLAPAAAAPAAQPADDAPGDPLATLDLGADRAARMTVPVAIGGLTDIPFVVDTGAERTVVSRQLAERLQLAPGPVRRLVTVTGTDQVRTVIVPQLEVSGTAIAPIEAPALEAVHIGAAGLLGLDSLQARRLVLDFKAGRMTVSAARKREERRDDDMIVVRAKSRFGQLILVDSSIEGQRIQVIVDTGAETSIGNLALLRRLGNRHRAGPLLPVALTSVTGDTISAQFAHIRQIRIGGLTLNNLPVAFTDAEPFRRFGLADRPAMLLGMDALRLFSRVSVDFANKQVRFVRGGSSAVPARTELAAR
jgi:predicted aspartyl protease